MFRLTRTVVACAVFTAALGFAAAPETVVKEATGQAAIVKGDEQKAFDEAQKSALRAAVEQAAGVFVQGATTTKNNVLVLDRVTANAAGYVKKFEVKSKSIDKGVMTVTVKAEVGVKGLEADVLAVRGIVDRLAHSKLLIVLQESSIDEKGIASRSEVLASELTKTFVADGWTIIDEKATGTSLTVSAGLATGKLDAKEVAKRTAADYVIYGSVNLRFLPPHQGQTIIPEVSRLADGGLQQLVFFVMGDYDLAMHETRTGRQLAKVAGRFRQLDAYGPKSLKSYSQTALELCAAEAPRIISELRNPAIEALRQQDVNGASVALQVGGIDFDAVEDFQKAIEAVRGVNKVSSTEYAEGKANYVVAFAGSSSDLGKALKGATFKKRKITVTTVRNNELEVVVAK